MRSDLATYFSFLCLTVWKPIDLAKYSGIAFMHNISNDTDKLVEVINLAKLSGISFRLLSWLRI